MSEEQKYDILNGMKIENIQLEETGNFKAHYTGNLVDKIMETVEPLMEKLDYIETGKYLLNNDKSLIAKYAMYEGFEVQGQLIIVSNGLISEKRGKEFIYADNDSEQVNQYNEIKYIETGEESKIAIDAGNSRPYTDFFDEFVPNTMEESKRAHKYTVSLHKAVCYSEGLEVFQKFDKIRFKKERTLEDFDKFLTNSCLYDPKDPNF